MKIFIGQRVTGEDIENLKEETEQIANALEKKGHEPYSTMEEDESQFENAGDWVKHAFKQLDEHDAFLAVVRSEDKSEGLLMEVGYALSKGLKFILAIQEDVKNTYLRDMADRVIEFKDVDDLINKVGRIK